MDIAALGLEIRSDGVVVAKNRLRELDDQADRTERRASALGATAARAFAAIAAALSVGQIIAYADAWSDMQSRVGAAIKDMAAAPVLMQRMVDIANASYSPLAQTVEIYSRNVGVLRELGLGAQQAADYTESLNHMLVITATRGERAASVQNALSKAMAMGKLTGEGLESVLANGGRVAEALAAELGTNVNGLRAMAAEGLITSGVISRALVGSLEQVRVEAGEMSATVSDAWVIMNNNVTAAIGTFDKAYGVSSWLAEGIISLANNLNIVGAGIAGLAATVGVALIPVMVSATAAMWAFTASLLANPLTWVALAVGAVVTVVVLLIQRMGGVGEAFLTVRTVAMDVWERIKAGGQSLADVMQGIALAIQGAFTRAFANIAEGFAAFVNSLGAGAGLIGLDGAGATSFATGLHRQAAGYEAGSQLAFGNASSNWERATGPRAAMDNVGLGTDWESFQQALGGATTAAGEASVAIGADGLAGAVGAANDNVKAANDNIWSMTESLGALGPATVDPLTLVGNQLRDLDGLLAQGKISWEEYGEAAFRANSTAAAGVLGLASGLTGAMAQMFQENKAFAVANAVVSTAEAVMKALATYGPTPWGFAAAGVAAATGAAQIAAIMSAQKGTSSAPKAPGGGGAGTAAAAAPAAQRMTQVNITLAGNGRYSRDEVRDLIEQFTDGINDGVDGGKFKVAVNQ